MNKAYKVTVYTDKQDTVRLTSSEEVLKHWVSEYLKDPGLECITIIALDKSRLDS